MKSRPILFSGEMVRALLEGRKTQTRRAFNPQPSRDWRPVVGHYHPTKIDRHGEEYPGKKIFGASDEEEGYICRYGARGDRLWVRENGWERPERSARDMREGADTWAPYYYDADGCTDVDADQFKAWGFKRRPSIHMPRWASRVTLEITGVRVERLNDISRDDVFAEGIQIPVDADTKHPLLAIAGPGIQPSKFLHMRDDIADPVKFIRAHYAALWENINGPDSWQKNPWVWVIEFKRLSPLTPRPSLIQKETP